MPEHESPESAWLGEECARQLIRVIESMTGDSPIVTHAPHQLSPADIKPEDEEFFWWEQPFTLAPEAIAWIGAGAASWAEIGNRVLQSAGVEGEDRETVRSTYLEIVNQALAGMASAITAKVRREVSCADGRQSAPPSVDLIGYLVDVTLGETGLPILLAFTKSLTQINEPPKPAPELEVTVRSMETAEPTKSGSIELLLDVELPVSVSFGRAQLPLKDVIKLTTGSIVELNRAVSEPVEVIVNNCVIARGEVVVVEGNFGIRIKQVISRQERLRTLN